MANLSVDFCGVSFPNPLVLSAGFPTGNGSRKGLRLMAEGGAGGVTSRSIFTEPYNPTARVRPRYVFDGGNLIHYDGKYESAAKFLYEELPAAHVEGIPVIVSILGKNMDNYETLGALCDKSPFVDIIEVNVSCPGMEEFGANIATRPNISQQPELVEAILSKVRKVTSKPLMAKLSATADNIGVSAQAAVSGGANAISAINTIPNAMSAIDLKAGRAKLPLLGAYGGPGIKPLALGAVCLIKKAVDVPILGIGGVTTWQDAIEMIMAGATLVGMGGAPLLHGSAVFKKVANGMSSFMDENGYKSVSEMCGLIPPHIYTLGELPDFDVRIKMDRDKCTDCGICKDTCSFEAIDSSIDPAVDTNKCTSCGLCTYACQQGALSIERL